MSVVILGETALQRRLAALSGPNAMVNWHKLVGLAAVREQKLLVHRKTGNTGRSIHLDSATAQKAITQAGGAAAFLEFGTRPHDIKPNAKKALFFSSQKATTARFGAGANLTYRLSGALSAASVRKYGAGAFVYAMIVHHPGTQPYPFMLPGAVAGVQQAGVNPFVEAWNSGL